MRDCLSKPVNYGLHYDEHEDKLIRKLLIEYGADAVAERLRRTKRGVIERATLIKARRKPSKPWTDDEIETLRTYYPRHGRKNIEHMLPGRSAYAIKTKVRDLGLERVGWNPSHNWRQSHLQE